MDKNNNLELLEYVKKLEKKIEIENEIKKLKKEKKKKYNILILVKKIWIMRGGTSTSRLKNI